MWCKTCRQDVPGLMQPIERCYCCMRCGTVMGTSAQPAAIAEKPVDEAPQFELDSPTLLGQFDDWELDEQLRHVDRVLHAQDGSNESPALRIDNRHPPRQRPAGERKSSDPLRTLLIGAGLIGLGFGVALVAWGWHAVRPDLWQIGLPVAIVSQLALVAGTFLIPGRKVAAPVAPVQNDWLTGDLLVSGDVDAPPASLRQTRRTIAHLQEELAVLSQRLDG